MTLRGIPSGGGVPSTWTTQTALFLGEESNNLALRNVLTIETDLSSHTDTAMCPEEPQAKLNEIWHVPDQGTRGTCTAFAVKAAEELWRYRNRTSEDPEELVPLSAEFLYSKMRDHSYTCVGVEVPDQQLEKQTRLGATYIAQARRALATAGVCPEFLAPYDASQAVAFRQKKFSETATDRAMELKVEESIFEHDIVQVTKGRPIGTGKVWRNRKNYHQDDGEPITTSKIFHDALAKGSPIVAAFALLNSEGKTAWVGARTRLCGQVVYPTDEFITRLRPVGGHAVCITGFVPNHDAAPGGTFVFRNSFGPFDFAWHATDKSRCPPLPLWRGYGAISSQDVDRYCWEYMFRMPADGPITGDLEVE